MNHLTWGQLEREYMERYSHGLFAQQRFKTKPVIAWQWFQWNVFVNKFTMWYVHFPTPPVSSLISLFEKCFPFGIRKFQSNHIQFPLFSSFRQRALNNTKNTKQLSVLFIVNGVHGWMVKASTHTKCATNTSNAIAHFYVNDVIAKVNIPWKSETYFADVIAVAAVLCCSVPSDSIWSHCVQRCRIRNGTSWSLLSNNSNNQHLALAKAVAEIFKDIFIPQQASVGMQLSNG